MRVVDAGDRLDVLLPWILLACFGFVPLAYWRDAETGGADGEAAKSRKRALIAASGSYLVLIAGMVVAIALRVDPEGAWTLFVLCLILALLFAGAGIITGAIASGWTRIAAIFSSAMLIGALIFTMSRCDL